MPPYTSYFEGVETVPTTWNLNPEHANKVCKIWENVCNELNTTYKTALTDDAEGYFKLKDALYDTAKTKSTYNSSDHVISEDEFKKLVDIERALLVLRALYTGGKKATAQVDYVNIWKAIKTKVGTGAAAESLAKKFNDTYCPEELYHYLHYLVKSVEEPSSMKPWVFKQNRNLNLRVWHRKKKTA
jgi:hypothetical protein